MVWEQSFVATSHENPQIRHESGGGTNFTKTLFDKFQSSSLSKSLVLQVKTDVKDSHEVIKLTYFAKKNYPRIFKAVAGFFSADIAYEIASFTLDFVEFTLDHVAYYKSTWMADKLGTFFGSISPVLLSADLFQQNPARINDKKKFISQTNWDSNNSTSYKEDPYTWHDFQNEAEYVKKLRNNLRVPVTVFKSVGKYFHEDFWEQVDRPLDFFEHHVQTLLYPTRPDLLYSVFGFGDSDTIKLYSRKRKFIGNYLPVVYGVDRYSCRFIPTRVSYFGNWYVDRNQAMPQTLSNPKCMEDKFAEMDRDAQAKRMEKQSKALAERAYLEQFTSEDYEPEFVYDDFVIGGGKSRTGNPRKNRRKCKRKSPQALAKIERNRERKMISKNQRKNRKAAIDFKFDSCPTAWTHMFFPYEREFYYLYDDYTYHCWCCCDCYSCSRERSIRLAAFKRAKLQELKDEAKRDAEKAKMKKFETDAYRELDSKTKAKAVKTEKKRRVKQLNGTSKKERKQRRKQRKQKQKESRTRDNLSLEDETRQANKRETKQAKESQKRLRQAEKKRRTKQTRNRKVRAFLAY